MKKQMIILLTIFVFGFSLTAMAQSNMSSDGDTNLYLVIGSNGPGFTSPQEAIQGLEKAILPTFDALLKLQKEGKIIASGLPVGDRSILFIMKASSNHEVDEIIRGLPAWPALTWKVKALESIAGRAEQERAIVKNLKGAMK